MVLGGAWVDADVVLAASHRRRHAVLDHAGNPRAGGSRPGHHGLKVIAARLAHAVAHQARARAVAPTGLVLVVDDFKILGMQHADLAAA